MLFTPAKTVQEFITGAYPVRLAPIGPTSEERSVLTTGPFAISREFYEEYFVRAKAILPPDALGVWMTIKRVEYEKCGAITNHAFTIRSDEDSFIEVARLSGIYDLYRPHVFSDFVWFDVTDEYKSKGESVLDPEQATREFWWWWVRVDFDEGFVPPIPSDQPEELSLIPEWFFTIQKKYLPEVVITLLPKLFCHLTLGLKLENLVLSADELANIINSVFEQQAYPSDDTEAIDRALLVKELCDFNGHTYPIDTETTISYLESMGIISATKNSIGYELATEFTIPTEFTITDEWEEKFYTFVETGSVLFAYMSLEEIVTYFSFR